MKEKSALIEKRFKKRRKHTIDYLTRQIRSIDKELEYVINKVNTLKGNI